MAQTGKLCRLVLTLLGSLTPAGECANILRLEALGEVATRLLTLSLILGTWPDQARKLGRVTSEPIWALT